MARKQRDELTTTEAARLLDVSQKTARRWAQSILDGNDVAPRGAPEVRLRHARRDASGYYYLRRSELAEVME